MITIHVDRGLDKPYAKAYWGRVDWRNKLPHVDSEYACGRYPPNYPMPAIPTDVYIRSDYVCIAARSMKHCDSDALFIKD